MREGERREMQKGGVRDSLDRFYTKPSEAGRLLQHIDLDEYDLRIEPSAGSGSFSDLVDSTAYDIEPAKEGIIKQDFLKLTKEELPEGEDILFFGNPPFGKRSRLAKEFITHAIELGADTIAFILPDIFNKRLNQTMFPSEWRLTKIVELQDSNFLLEEEEIFIPCSFFIWTKKRDLLPGVNLREFRPETPSDFKIVPRGSDRADFTINGNNGLVKELSEVTNPKAEHYIEVVDNDVEEMKERFRTLEFSFQSSVNGGVAWINREDIYRAYNELIPVEDNRLF